MTEAGNCLPNNDAKGPSLSNSGNGGSIKYNKIDVCDGIPL